MQIRPLFLRIGYSPGGAPPPPNIQDFLRKAYFFKKRMRDNPELTREVLAQEEGIDLVQMGKILSLLTLTPATQQAILAMPKEKITAIEKEFWGLVTERTTNL